MFENLSNQDKLLSCKFLLHLPELEQKHRANLSVLLDDIGLLNEDNIPLKYDNIHILKQVDQQLDNLGWVQYTDWQTDLLSNVKNLW